MFNLRQRLSSAANRIKSFFFGSDDTDSIDRDIDSIDKAIDSIDKEFTEPKRTVWSYEWTFDEPDQPDELFVSDEISDPDPSHKPDPPYQQEPTGQQEPLDSPDADPLEEPDPTDEPDEEARLMEEYERWITKAPPTDEPLDPEPFHDPDDTDDLDDDGPEFHLARYLMDDEYSRQIDEDYGWSDLADAVENIWFNERKAESEGDDLWGHEDFDEMGDKIYHLWELEAMMSDGNLELRRASLSPFFEDVQAYIKEIGAGAEYFKIVYDTERSMYAAIYFSDA